nr:MAG TPA: hypothetical protein [Caudoviricetes sp.]
MIRYDLQHVLSFLKMSDVKYSVCSFTFYRGYLSYIAITGP